MQSWAWMDHKKWAGDQYWRCFNEKDSLMLFTSKNRIPTSSWHSGEAPTEANGMVGLKDQRVDREKQGKNCELWIRMI